MNIEKEVEQFRSILTNLSKAKKEVRWIVVSDADVDYQLSVLPKVAESLFPDLTILGFDKKASNEEILDGLKEITKQLLSRIDSKRVEELRAGSADEYSISLGI